MTDEGRELRTDDLTSRSRPVEDEDNAVETERPDTTAPPPLEPLLPRDEEDDFRRRWEDIQTGFVDEPRRAVEEADSLVARLMERLAESFSEQRNSLEQQWDRGDEISTEELRVTLQRYRSFFDRLLKA
jgi:hypothetical protein